ncbi:hypothetical protein [Georgenia sp. Z1491]|uniref:hypothetical protein n=1 Tax=Georgenia sp. Z1491 TaxID=3416707 RepID=UPI003CF2FF33
MIRRILAALLAVLGVTAIVLAILSATSWRDEDELTASLAERPGTPILLTDPGVLEMGADEVTVTLTADPGEEIWYTFVPTSRVTEWVGDAERTSVTGLESRTELASAVAGTESTVPHPSGSDLFRDADVGTGEVTLDRAGEPGGQTLFAVVDGTADAPSLTLSWPQEVETPYLVPGLVAGGVLLLVALALLLWPSRRPGRDGGRGAGADAPAGVHDDRPAVDDELAASRTGSGAYDAAPAAGRPTTDPYAPEVADARGSAASADDAGTHDRSGTEGSGTSATHGAAFAGAGAASATAALGTAAFAPREDDAETIDVVEHVDAPTDAADAEPEAVDAALAPEMAALAARERAGESLRRHERRVLAEARREAHDDLRAGVDTEVREDLRSAGSSRGAGILPYSPRADAHRGSADAPGADTPTSTVDADQALADAEAAQAAGRPLTRRERRALDRRARLGDAPGAATSTGEPDAGGDAGPAHSDGTPTTMSSGAATTTTDDEWRDLWGFGPRSAPENRR